ncbi:hypothetical protein LINPERPRIM_LOCUS2457 [Linum perenne]
MFEQDSQFVDGSCAEIPRQQFRSRTIVGLDVTAISSPVEAVCSIGSYRPTHDQVTPITQVGQCSVVNSSSGDYDNEILDLGLPTFECQFCGALYWSDERLKKSKNTEQSQYSLCCQLGKVDIPLLQSTPPLLDTLLDVNGGSLSKHFRTNVRLYNAAFSWTSFGAKFDPMLLNSRGPYSLVLCGENYHYMGSLLPPEGKKPRYSQLYVHDPTFEVQNRVANVSSAEGILKESVVDDLRHMLDEYNVLARSFRQVREALQQPQNQNLRLRITGARVPNGREYALPTGSELAGLIPGDFEPSSEDRDIIVNNCETGLTRITSLNPLFDSLHFPMLFPHGNDGFHTTIRYNPVNVPSGQKRKHVTQREYYCFRLQYRHSEGGIRYMKQLFFDATAICHYFGNPDMFITFTSNAQWSEITSAFKDDIGSHGEDKPQVVARVFRMKLLRLKKDIDSGKLFGKTVAGMHTIEFQKRGLPHVHILVWLIKEAKLDTAAQIDNVISAELPDPSIDPIGYTAGVKFMLHGPCGEANPASPYMKNGITAVKSGNTLDNRYVVPYNRELIVKYQAHINVEACHKGQLIKYLFKYITKGPDRSSVVATSSESNTALSTDEEPHPIDEIAQYLDCRSISSYEAVWRLFQYPIHERTPNVVRLCIHLEDQQNVCFDASQPVRSIVGRPGIQNTMLTQWFSLNERCPSARKYMYDQISNAFVYNDNYKDWFPRKKGFAVGRIPSVPPAAGDLFYLRILLGKVSGARSIQDLRTFKGVIYRDYQEACRAMGLLATDDEWHSVMSEVNRWGQLAQMRSVFVSLLILCHLSDPNNLFQQWWECMAEDFIVNSNYSKTQRHNNAQRIHTIGFCKH